MNKSYKYCTSHCTERDPRSVLKYTPITHRNPRIHIFSHILTHTGPVVQRGGHNLCDLNAFIGGFTLTAAYLTSALTLHFCWTASSQPNETNNKLNVADFKCIANVILPPVKKAQSQCIWKICYQVWLKHTHNNPHTHYQTQPQRCSTPPTIHLYPMM